MFGKEKSAAAAAGLVLGLATLVRPTNVLAVIVFALAILACHRKSGLRAAFTLCAASAIGVAILLAHNAVLFGSPFAFVGCRGNRLTRGQCLGGDIAF